MMRDANWDEIFQRRDDVRPAPSGAPLNSIIPWEDWLTFFIASVCFLSVVHSIDSANWVKDMPSLYPIGFSALLAGYVISRVKLSEALLHPVALFIGASLVFLQLMAVIPGGSPYVRTDALLDRMHDWWSAITQGGISNDTLPFIVLVLVVTWVGAYVSSWSIFRWRNPWLALIPGGIALMWNISFIPGQFDFSFVIFLFGAVLLIMRLHVSHKEHEWERGGVAYPEFISLSVLNATFWVTVALLLAVWALPLAERSDSASARWQSFTAPYTRRLEPLARVFVSVNAKKPIAIHNLKDALAFQGQIKLSSKDAVEVNVTLTPEMAAFLRNQSFDEYTSAGWKLNVDGDVPLAPATQATSAPDATDPTSRTNVTINVKVEGGHGDSLFTLGQPVETDKAANAKTGSDPSDVTALKPADSLENGDQYTATGSVSAASLDQLRAAGTDYPSWVTDRYLPLPDSLPRRVGRQARDLTASASNPYDKAAAIEKYLRTFPVDYTIEKTPPGRDTVDYFLFDLRRGYFDYHASAMAVMLRTLGIPARVASGYLLDPLRRDGDSNTYKLTEKEAFAWPEVYFPGIGWVEFSPTPGPPLITRPGTPKTTTQPGSNPQGTEDLDLGGLSGLEGAAPGIPQDSGASNDGGGSSSWNMLIALAVVGAIGIVATAGARFAWEFGLSGLPRPAQLWRKTQRLARWSRNGGEPSETPREFAARLRGSAPAGDVKFLAAAYERSTFGHKELEEAETERLEAAWQSIRNALLSRMLRRKQD